MINSILIEAQTLINSDTYYETLDSIGKEFDLSEDVVGYISSTTSSIVLGSLPEASFVENLMRSIDLDKTMCENIYARVKKLILDPFKLRVASIVSSHTDQQMSAKTSNEPLRELHPSKSQILHEIENPVKTSIKKYVIEYDHSPLKDTIHLLADKVDDTLRLQDHYDN